MRWEWDRRSKQVLLDAMPCDGMGWDVVVLSPLPISFSDGASELPGMLDPNVRPFIINGSTHRSRKSGDRCTTGKTKRRSASVASEQDAEAKQNGEIDGSTWVEQHVEAERAERKRRFRAVTFEQDTEAERAGGGTGSEASEQRRSHRTGGGSTWAVAERETAGERGRYERNTAQRRRGWSATQIEDLRIEEWPNGGWWLNTGLWRKQELDGDKELFPHPPFQNDDEWSLRQSCNSTATKLLLWIAMVVERG
ncbi:hypothetical protein PIB30_044049 [Stylosanthes scabra]|uniref:Uncharacterized protein n=1 Tax=Stylosanthes scabra TaxID=79078 RepID=A0ABU6TFH0_9FABA|nr:hypothetical protein [Stylosanthes scabra]